MSITGGGRESVKRIRSYRTVLPARLGSDENGYTPTLSKRMVGLREDAMGYRAICNLNCFVTTMIYLVASISGCKIAFLCSAMTCPLISCQRRSLNWDVWHIEPTDRIKTKMDC